MQHTLKAGLLVACGLIAWMSAAPATADILIEVEKSSQTMTVTLDGSRLYVWSVSTGRRDRWTPNGSFKPFWLHADHYSSKYNRAPMPHSIFFNGDIAIHGTTEVGMLGNRASHGCVRLHREHAAKLFELVQRTGMQRTTVVVRG